MGCSNWPAMRVELYHAKNATQSYWTKEYCYDQIDYLSAKNKAKLITMK